MDGAGQLTELQIDFAEIFFSLDAAKDYLVAGGAALLASHLIVRPTEDLDLFAGTPTTSVTQAKDAFVEAITERGWEVAMIQDGVSFCRMVVSRAGEQTLVDLAIGSPAQSSPTITVLGPTLAPLELAGRKLLALFGRAEACDFADVLPARTTLRQGCSHRKSTTARHRIRCGRAGSNAPEQRSLGR